MQSGESIAKLLEPTLISGRKSWDVLEDWLDVVEASLTMLPVHAESVAAIGRMAEDTPEIKALWARLNTVYRPNDWECFKAALTALTDRAAHVAQQRGNMFADNWDILGEAYMMLNVWSGHSGQFFTPWSVARAMAQLTCTDINDELTRRVLAAAEKLRSDDPAMAALVDSAMLVGKALDDVAVLEQYVWPALALHVDPITVNDPACGSGVMLLAVAANVPAWATRWMFVRFSGQDIDRTCVKLARINLMLYGLNGWGLRWMRAGMQLQARLAPQVDAVTEVESGTEPTIAADYELRQGSLLDASEPIGATVPDVAAPRSRRAVQRTEAGAASGLFDSSGESTVFDG
jgi:hypothetical protein